MNALSHHQAVRPASPMVRARAARTRRLRHAAVWAGVFFVLTGLLAWGAAETDTGDTQNVIAVMATACFVFFCMALVEAVRLALRARREANAPQREANSSFSA